MRLLTWFQIYVPEGSSRYYKYTDLCKSVILIFPSILKKISSLVTKVLGFSFETKDQESNTGLDTGKNQINTENKRACES